MELIGKELRVKLWLNDSGQMVQATQETAEARNLKPIACTCWEINVPAPCKNQAECLEWSARGSKIMKDGRQLLRGHFIPICKDHAS